MNIKLSTIITSYNYASFLHTCIQSVLNKDFFDNNSELIIVDDGSTDNTKDVVNHLGANVHYIYQNNSGLSAARNTGISAAKGDYLLFLDADDLISPSTVYSQISFLDTHGDIDIAVCQSQLALSMGPESPLCPIGFWQLFSDKLPIHLCHLNIAPVHAFMIRRDCAIHNGPFDTTLKACEDYDYWFRCAAKGMIFSTNPATHVVYRKHAGSMSAGKANQLKHDTVMHFRASQGIAQSNYLSPYHESWLAHAAGCLVTAFRLFSIGSQQYFELFDLCLHSITEAAKRLARVNRQCEITKYYANKLMLHLRLFAFLHNPVLKRIESVMYRLHPEASGSRTTLTRRDSELASNVHHPQSYSAQSISATTDQSKKHILLASDFFWPSIGGCELFLGDLGTHLVNNGYIVHVATRALSERASFTLNGMHIIEFKCSGRFRDRALGEQYEAYSHFLKDASYDVAFIIGQPDSWLHAPLLATIPQTPIHLIPIINQELVDDWRRLGHDHLIATVLHRATSCLSLTESGLDARYLQAAGVSPTYVPHALTPFPPSIGFRERHQIPADIPLLVHVGNFWPVKNQMELVQHFSASPGNWQLALIGSALPWPEEKKYYDRVKQCASQDPRIRIIGQLPPHEADAAIAEADLLLLPSKAECRPLVILQAMRHGTPWIATPECNSVHDDAGGVVCDINLFTSAVDKLIHSPAIRYALGTLGKEHWESCFSWDKVLPLFIDLIEEGKTLRNIKMPSGIRNSKINLEKKLPLYNSLTSSK